MIFFLKNMLMENESEKIQTFTSTAVSQENRMLRSTGYAGCECSAGVVGRPPSHYVFNNDRTNKRAMLRLYSTLLAIFMHKLSLFGQFDEPKNQRGGVWRQG